MGRVACVETRVDRRGQSGRKEGWLETSRNFTAVELMENTGSYDDVLEGEFLVQTCSNVDAPELSPLLRHSNCKRGGGTNSVGGFDL